MYSVRDIDIDCFRSQICVATYTLCIIRRSGKILILSSIRSTFYSNSKFYCISFVTAQSSFASMVLGILLLSVFLSVCMSVRHTHSLWRNERAYYRYLLLHERLITLVSLYQQRFGSNNPFPLKFALRQVTHPFEKRPIWPISAYNVWTIRATEKFSIIANRKSTTHFPTSYRWSEYVTPKSPKGWLKKRICRFC